MTDWHNSQGSGPFPIVQRADLVEQADAALDRTENAASGIFCARCGDKIGAAEPSSVNNVAPRGGEISSC